MGRLDELRNSWKAATWGYRDSQRLRSLRLDQEYRDSLKEKTDSREPADWLDVALTLEKADESLKRELRIQSEEIVRLRNTVHLLSRKESY